MIEFPKVSIVIPALNEEKYISNCINSFIFCKYPTNKIEIIIIDGGSTDNTIDIINSFQKKYPFIKLLINKKKITPIALNIGIENSKHEIIMISSAHASFSPDYLNKCIDALIKLKADGIGGIIKTEAKNKTKKSLAIIKILSHKFGVGNSMFRIGIKEAQLVDKIPFGIYKKKTLL